MATTEKALVTEPKGKSANYWEQWIGKQMVFQTKSHAMIKGKLIEFRNMFLTIETATIEGTKSKATPKTVMLDRNFISHFHEECEVETLES